MRHFWWFVLGLLVGLTITYNYCTKHLEYRFSVYGHSIDKQGNITTFIKLRKAWPWVIKYRLEDGQDPELATIRVGNTARLTDAEIKEFIKSQYCN